MKKLSSGKRGGQSEDGGRLIKGVQTYIKSIKKGLYRDLKLDHKLGVDPYDTVARLKICEKIEKFIVKRGGNNR